MTFWCEDHQNIWAETCSDCCVSSGKLFGTSI